MKLIDTHCHFDDIAFDHDRENLLHTMATLAVSDLILPAISAQYWQRLRNMCQKNKECHASYGLHPMYLAQHQPEHLSTLRHWLATEQPVAVGECGLDLFVPNLDLNRQETIFTEHLRLACEFNLPLIIHARRSVDLVLKHLRRFPSCRGVIHSFAGSLQQAELLIKQGFYLGIGGTLTYERAQRLRHIASHIPIEAIVLETDAPDQPDSLWRGQRNDPTRLPIIAQTLAELRQTTLTEIATMTTQNAQRLFALTQDKT